jgi:hypothetical protein
MTGPSISERRPEMWQATLNPSSPNFETWLEILRSNRLPLQSATSVSMDLGEEKDIEVYLLNIEALPLPRRAAFLAHIAEAVGEPIYRVEAEIQKHGGFPILAADVIVSPDVRKYA